MRSSSVVDHGCQPSPEVREAIRNLPDGYTNIKERRSAIPQLLALFPDDVFVHQQYQRFVAADLTKGPEVVSSEYQTLLSKYPGDRMYAFLAANALVGFRTKEGIPLLEKLADYPLSHLVLATIYYSTNFKDSTKLSRHLESFMNSCPATLEPFGYLGSVEASDFLKRASTTLRSLLQDRLDAEAIAYYPQLWASEFKMRPLAEHGELRKQVAEDVRRLRTVYDSDRQRGFLRPLQQGYQLTKDSENAKWAEAEWRKGDPPLLRAASAFSEWHRQNPEPKPTDPPEKIAEYFRARFKAYALLAQEFPDDPMVQAWHVGALKAVEQTDPNAVQAAGDALLRLSNDRAYALNYTNGFNYCLLAAELFAIKGVRIDMLPELVDKLSREIDLPPRGFRSDLFAEQGPEYLFNQAVTRIRSWSRVASLWVKLKEKEKARAAFAHADGDLRKLGSGRVTNAKDQGLSDEQRRAAAALRGRYWVGMAELAQFEGRKLDALACFQNAILARSAAAAEDQVASDSNPADKARVLWKELGGTNEGWQAWINVRPAPAADASTRLGWTQVERRIPEFDLADMSGKRWTLAGMKGKTVLMSIWASW